MQDDKEREGVNIPNLKLYYQAARLIWITEWLLCPEARKIHLEKANLKKGFHYYLWNKKQLPERLQMNLT